MQYFLLGILGILPVLTFAAAPTNFQGVVALILGYVKLLIPLIFSLTFIVIVWGVVNAWIINGGDSEKRKEGNQIALWGVIGLVAMLGMWGVIALLRSSIFGI